MENFVMKKIVGKLSEQKQDLVNQGLTKDDIENIVFCEEDVVEMVLQENGINEEGINLEELRQLQHDMVRDVLN